MGMQAPKENHQRQNDQNSEKKNQILYECVSIAIYHTTVEQAEHKLKYIFSSSCLLSSTAAVFYTCSRCLINKSAAVLV